MRDERCVWSEVVDTVRHGIAVAAVMAALAAPAYAAGPFTVNTTADTNDAAPGNGLCADAGGQCSLRAAIEEASASGGATVITLPSGTYALSLGDLIVGTQAGTTITVNGAGPGATTIRQTQSGLMVFLVNFSVDANVVFNLAGVTVTGGSENELDPNGFGGNGGAILAGGSSTAPGNGVTITNVTFSNNFCNPVSNAGCAGGAIEMTGGGDLTVANSTFLSNAAVTTVGTGFGGAINFDNGANPGNVTITNSTFANNSAHNGQGGALALAGGPGTAFVITGNTFTANAGGASSQGGAIYQPTGTLTARYNRIVGNTAGSGGGIYVGNNSGTTADARDNWWGCNGGPGTAGCDATFPATSTTPPLASGQLAFDPWIVLAHSASPATIPINQSATLTAGFLQDNHGAAIVSGNLAAFVGVPVRFHNPILGAILNAQPEAITLGGTASATYKAGGTGGAGSAQATVDNATVTANITVLQPPAISKGFSPATVAPGSPSALAFGLTNPNSIAIDATFTDTLPTGLVVASTPGIINGCGGTVTAVAGAGSVSFANAALAAGSCTIQVKVQAAVDGSYSNSVTVGSTAAGTGNTATALLIVVAPPSITKAFGGSSLPLNGTTSLTLTLVNPNTATALTGLAFTDTLPAGLTVAPTPGLANTCGGTAAGIAGSGSVSLTGASLPAGGSCTVSLNVAGTTAGVKNNSVQVTSTEGGTSGTATASLTVASPPTIGKAFGTASIPLNATTSLTLTLVNPNTATGLTGLAFTDNLPAGLTVAPTPGLANTCGGTATGIAGSGSVSLTGASLAKGGSCAVSLNVEGTTAGVKNNSVQVTSTEGAGNIATASLTVVDPPTISKAFGTASISLNATTSLTLTLVNPNTATVLTGLAFTDTLPAGLTVAPTPGLANTCGGTAAGLAGSGSVSLTGASLAAAGSCAVSLNVEGTTAGVKNNSVQVTSTEGGTSGTATAALTVIAPPSIAKAFNPAAIAVNGTSTLTFTLTNPNGGTVLTGVAFTDTLPTGLTVATSSGTACGGPVTTTAPTTIALSGASIGTGGQCQFSVTVTGASAGQYTNTTDAVPSTNGGTGNSATATLAVGAPDLTVTKNHTGAFAQAEVGAQYTITASNVGSAPTDGTAVTVTDALPAGLTATAMSGTGWSCNVGTASCTRSDALAAGTSCPPITLTVTVAANAPPSLTNTVTVSGGGDASPANNTGSDTATISAPIPLLGGPGLAVLMLALVAVGAFTLARRG